MSTTTDNRYSLAEEITSTAIHLLGAALGISALAILTTLAVQSGDAWKIFSLSIYGSTLVMMYLSSVLYHSFQAPGLKRIFRRLDHSSIYLLIAGTYTPFTLINLRGPWGWSLFGLIWGLALSGLFMTVFRPGRSRLLASLLYIGMGWLVVIAIKPLLEAVPARGIVWLIAGGLSYTFGVLFYMWKRLPFNHAIWHLFVLGGSVCHFFAILFYVLPG